NDDRKGIFINSAPYGSDRFRVSNYFCGTLICFRFAKWNLVDKCPPNLLLKISSIQFVREGECFFITRKIRTYFFFRFFKSSWVVNKSDVSKIAFSPFLPLFY